jgi:hypothetical protein
VIVLVPLNAATRGSRTPHSSGRQARRGPGQCRSRRPRGRRRATRSFDRGQLALPCSMCSTGSRCLPTVVSDAPRVTVTAHISAITNGQAQRNDRSLLRIFAGFWRMSCC